MISFRGETMYEEYLKHINMEVTEEIHKFVDDYVFGNSEYLFVTREKNNIKGYCSKCKHEFDVGDYGIEVLEQNEGIICPLCGAKLIVKLTRYGRKNCLNEACMYYFEKSVVDPEVVVCKGYYVAKDYSVDFNNPKEEFDLKALYVFEKNKAKMFTHDWWGRTWDMRSTVFDFNQGWLAPKMCHCSFESIENAIQGTSLQYAPYKQYAGYYSMVKFFAEYAKHPGIEQLIKIGLGSLIESKFRGYSTYKAINWNGKDIYKMLRISRKDLKDIKESGINITYLFLRLFQIAKRDKAQITFKELKDMEHDYSSNIDDLSLIVKYISLRKADKYLRKQYKEYKKRYYGLGQVLRTYRDYILDCIELQYDLKDEHVLFPKDIYTAHQNTTTQVKIKENKVYDEQIEKRLEALQKYNFEHGELFIRPAGSSKELIIESAELRHCVAAHYTEAYAKGKTDILLIRKVEEPEKPFYTMEVKNNEVNQVHGIGNCNPDAKVQAFVRVFKKERLQKKKNKDKIPA